MGCNFENTLNYTKFHKAKQYNARFCIDPEGDYKLQGNLDYSPLQMIQIKIDRCTKSATQECKSAPEIDKFIKYLEVVTWYQDYSMLINNYDMKPPLDQSLKIKIQQLDPY